ncbi:ImmA/IrrE family metallo-endopeptidase [Parasaccharibacter sp. TMW 2.1886]|nr:ImmA/IrrE family metallo-endopeptidase [Parasaccharibacter sp. TMW 2.1886]
MKENAVPDHGVRAPNFRKAREEAARLIKELGLKEPPVDPRKVAEYLGVSVSYYDFPEEFKNVSGYIQSQERNIIVNNDQSANRMFFTIAHELGHDVLHRDYATSNSYRVLPRNDKYEGIKPPEEVEADIFAANLLVPFPLLKKYDDFASISELARLFMVSNDVVRNQMYWMKATGNG